MNVANGNISVVLILSRCFDDKINHRNKIDTAFVFCEGELFHADFHPIPFCKKNCKSHDLAGDRKLGYCSSLLRVEDASFLL